MNSNSSFLTLILFILFIIGELTFMLGFFPISYNEDNTYAEEKHLPQFVGSTSNYTGYLVLIEAVILLLYVEIRPPHTGQFDPEFTIQRSVQSSHCSHLTLAGWNISRYRRQYERVILMVIDAMRFDFVNSSGMNYVKERFVKGEACLHKLKVEAPTVTMPRIKSLTTGTLSTFIDVVLNFGSTELLSDSIMYQMFRRGDKVYFYGDNTWAKLFPQKFFKEYANNDSFFVHDFYNGDKQITHDVLKDVNDGNWDFLILHYLGLDHIGHIEGPFSEKVPSKLAEMDGIINKLSNSLKSMNNSIMLVTADHGMRDSGGHGGNSNPEIIVPLLTFDAFCKTNYIYNQIDFAPTLSVLLGLPIPESSIGCIITELIEFMRFEDQLYALYYNNKRLIQKLTDMLGNNITETTAYTSFDLGLRYHEEFLKSKESSGTNKFFERAKFNYVKSTRALSKNLSSKLNNFDMPAVVIGILLATISNLLIISGAVCCYSCRFHLSDVLWMTLLSVIIGVLVHFMCDSFFDGSQICNSMPGCFIICLTTFIWLWGSVLYYQAEWQSNYRKKPYMLFGSIIYTASLLSSSFIEEEHQTWYYMVTTLLMYLCIKEVLSETQKQIMKCEPPDGQEFSWECVFDFNSWITDRNPYKGKIRIKNQFHYPKCAIKWVFVLTMHVLIRRLNQTGDKWIHIADVGDWLNTQGNELVLDMFSMFGVLLTIISINQICSKSTILLSTVGACLILLFRLKFRVPLLLFWLCILGIFFINILPLFFAQKDTKKYFLCTKDFLGANVVSLNLIAMLLHKPHNIILVPACILTLKAIFSACNNICRRKELIASKILSALWIGKTFFFYQGNSNNLASIDLNPGFVGLNEYHFYLAAIFIAFNTFSGPICSLLVLFYELYEIDEIGKSENNISDMMSLTTLFYALPACVYLFFMILFRSHLFIWSVFSPKFLYEICTLCIVCIILIFLFTLYKCLRLK